MPTARNSQTQPANGTGGDGASDDFSARLAAALSGKQKTFPHQHEGWGSQSAAGATAKSAGSTAGQGAASAASAAAAPVSAASPASATAPAGAATATASEPPSDAVAEDETAPVGSGDHVVRSGECVSSIAKGSGHFWETLWEEPGNSELREVRQNPNVLLEGDRVTVPPIEPKQEPGASEQRHRFVRRGEPSLLRLRVLENDKPRGNEPYTLEIDGQTTLEGVTDADGNIVLGIPGDAKQGVLTVGEGAKQLKYSLQLGQTDPVSTTTGVQQRLKNLGFDTGGESGKAGPRTEAALRAFQEKQGLTVTGQADATTRERLEQVHGS